MTIKHGERKEGETKRERQECLREGETELAGVREQHAGEGEAYGVALIGGGDDISRLGSAIFTLFSSSFSYF